MGMYIGIEGPDGCGKSTLVYGLYGELLATTEWDVIQTNEPGGNPLGKQLRAILKDPKMQAVTHPLTRRMIFEADRITQQALVRQWLALGKVVISDRHCPVSNTAYGIAEGSSIAFIRALEALDPDRLLADLVVLVEVPLEVSLERQRARGAGVDPAERDRNMFISVCHEYEHMIVQAKDSGYITTLSNFKIPAVVVNGLQHPGAVVAEALVAINSRIPLY